MTSLPTVDLNDACRQIAERGQCGPGCTIELYVEHEEFYVTYRARHWKEGTDNIWGNQIKINSALLSYVNRVDIVDDIIEHLANGFAEKHRDMDTSPDTKPYGSLDSWASIRPLQVNHELRLTS